MHIRFCSGRIFSRTTLQALLLSVAVTPLAAPTAFAQTARTQPEAAAQRSLREASLRPAIAASTQPGTQPSYQPSEEASLLLPESPGAMSSSRPETPDLTPEASPSTALSLTPGYRPAYFQNVPPNDSPVAGRFDKYIKPGQQAPRLTVVDKLGLGVRDAFSPLSIAGWATAAEYSQLVNGSPNYGTNGEAFLQRLGAASARAASEGVFSDSIMASVLHEDPRYYKRGRSHSFISRTVYAATRPIITRTDGGHHTINFAYLSGNLAGAALTQAYYPPINRGTSQVMQTWGGSIGGGSVGFLAAEFLDDLLQAVHLEKAR